MEPIKFSLKLIAFYLIKYVCQSVNILYILSLCVYTNAALLLAWHFPSPDSYSPRLAILLFMSAELDCLTKARAHIQVSWLLHGIWGTCLIGAQTAIQTTLENGSLASSAFCKNQTRNIFSYVLFITLDHFQPRVHDEPMNLSWPIVWNLRMQQINLEKNGSI